ncbi:protein conserved only in the green lineage 160 [Quercus suber]|uniref:Protein conserved only in the green lineage 160 n=1 Tax=Quercus suber TaxID=58331 RepID=A0AAW0M6J5_QUESU
MWKTIKHKNHINNIPKLQASSLPIIISTNNGSSKLHLSDLYSHTHISGLSNSICARPKADQGHPPKKKPLKWSTGVAPGDYAGPPTSTKLRKYWGGEEEDPLSSDEFLWNKDFMARYQRLIQDPESSVEATPTKEKPSGFLSLNRVMNLDSLEVDLSRELTAPSKPALEKQVEATAQV